MAIADRESPDYVVERLHFDFKHYELALATGRPVLAKVTMDDAVELLERAAASAVREGR